MQHLQQISIVLSVLIVLLNLPAEHFSRYWPELFSARGRWCWVIIIAIFISICCPSLGTLVLFLTSWWEVWSFLLAFILFFLLPEGGFHYPMFSISCRPCKGVFVGVNLSEHPLCSTWNHLTFYDWMSNIPQWYQSNPFAFSSFHPNKWGIPLEHNL